MSVFMPHWPKPLGYRPIEIDLKLERVLKILKRMGDPQNFAPPVIHVAGTNGKGSTVAFLKAILENSGYCVHAYTSPHLVHFNERIVICGKQIDDAELFRELEEARMATGDEKITFFEGTTIAAISAFAKNKADFCLIEIGMGGRLDATNVFENPVLTIITSIAYDHINYLGNTLQKIAYEKAGIMKPGSPCIITEQVECVMQELEKQAIKKRTPVFRCNFEWKVRKLANTIEFWCGGDTEEFAIPNLLGSHQLKNAGNAIAAVTMLANKFGYNKISWESINSGLQNAKWPARLEKIIDNNELIKLMPTGFGLFLDGAHNTAGAQTIADWLDGKKTHIILGMTREKDTKGFLKAIEKNIASLHAVCVQSEPRSQSSEEICNTATALGIECTKAQSLKDAVCSIAKNSSGGKDILICGSLFLAKDVSNYS